MSRPSASAITTACSTVTIAPRISVVSGSTALTSLPRRSHPAKFALCSSAPARSTSWNVDSSHRAPVRSASRMRTPTRVALRRSAPGSPTSDQFPPVICVISNVHRSNMLPTSLHSVNFASKKLQFTNVQFRNAAPTCSDALNFARLNVHSVNTAPVFLASVRSRSTNRTRVCACAEMSSSDQSTRDCVTSVLGVAAPPRRSAKVQRPRMHESTSARRAPYLYERAPSRPRRTAASRRRRSRRPWTRSRP